jgi:hypothetical protein
MKRRNKTTGGVRAYSPEAQAKYIGIRGGMSRKLWLNEVLDQQLFMHLQREYGNQAELESILKLSGRLGALRLGFKLTATKEDMQRYYGMAERARYDKKFALTKAEAVARFATGKDNPPRPVSRARPGEFMANPKTPYRPRPGSSKGKVKTIVRGGRKTLGEFEKFIKALFSMQPGKRKAHMPTVRRTISKIIDQ